MALIAIYAVVSTNLHISIRRLSTPTQFDAPNAWVLVVVVVWSFLRTDQLLFLIFLAIQSVAFPISMWLLCATTRIDIEYEFADVLVVVRQLTCLIGILALHVGSVFRIRAIVSAYLSLVALHYLAFLRIDICCVEFAADKRVVSKFALENNRLATDGVAFRRSKFAIVATKIFAFVVYAAQTTDVNSNCIFAFHLTKSIIGASLIYRIAFVIVVIRAKIIKTR